MLREAIELIQQTAVKADHAHKLFEHRDGRHATFCVDGEVQQFDLGEPSRCHQVETLEDLIQYAKDCDQIIDKQSEECPCGGQTIWHNKTCVTLVCDVEGRHDIVAFPLAYSRATAKLIEMVSDGRFTQS
jgi:hypothetical protein